MKLMNLYFDIGLNVTTDSFSTNFSTTKLKKHKLTIVRTVSQKEVSCAHIKRKDKEYFFVIFNA